MTELYSAPCKAALSKSSLPGLDYTFNPYVGCSHGCIYCYVPDILRNRIGNYQWGSRVGVKENVLQKLKSDLKKTEPGVVGISTATDPYQRVERNLLITRTAISLVNDAGFQISIQTKSDLVLRDLDLLGKSKVEVGLTITSPNDAFIKLFEPNAPLFSRRAKALKEISEAGIRTWIFLGPIIRGFNDNEKDVEKIVGLAEETKSQIIYDKINLKPLVSQRLAACLPKGILDNNVFSDWYATYSMIDRLCRLHGINSKRAF